MEFIISAGNVMRQCKAELSVCGSGLHNSSIVGRTVFTLDNRRNIFILPRSRLGKVQRNRAAGFSCCGSFRYPKSTGIVQKCQFPFVPAVFRDFEHSVSSTFAANGCRNEEDRVRLQVEGRAGGVGLAYPFTDHSALFIDRPRRIRVHSSRRTEPPYVCTIAIIGDTRIVIGKSVGCIFRFLCREEKHLVPIQDVVRSGIVHTV